MTTPSGPQRAPLHRFILLGTGIAIAALSAPPAHANDWYVDVESVGAPCSDTNGGASLEEPLCSLSACLQRANQPGDRCILREGRYTPSAMSLGDGVRDAPLSIESFPGEVAEIWGSVPLPGVVRRVSSDVYVVDAPRSKPLALVERTARGMVITYHEWVPDARRTHHPSGFVSNRDGMPAGSWVEDTAVAPPRIRLRVTSRSGDARAALWRARVAVLDLRGRSAVTFKGIAFVDMLVRLEGSSDIRFDDCVFGGSGDARGRVREMPTEPPPAPPDSEAGSANGDPRSYVGAGAPADPGDASGPAPALTTGGTPPPDAGGPPPLQVSEGGTGATNAPDARENLGAAADADVVHVSGSETITGTKTFENVMNVSDVNGVFRSAAYGGITNCVSNLPESGGVCRADPDVADATPLADANPDLRRNALVSDWREGGMRWISSKPEPTSGATEDQVPFVFQVRWDDPSRDYDDEPGATGEWNCGIDLPGAFDEWRNCPAGHITAGDESSIQPFWYTGQCNTNPSSSSNTCGGPHIFEVRAPEVSGAAYRSKPVFAVGSEGASVYMPDAPNVYFHSAFTIFRGASSYFAPKENTPMYAFDTGGLLADGGLFVGGTPTWPAPYSSHNYPPFNAWIQDDLASDTPAFVVEGTSDGSPEGEKSPIAVFYDRSGKGSYDHPGNDRKAFGFYSDSRLYLGSFRNSDGGGQVVEWEGRTVDGITTRLAAADPTAARTITLPDLDGYVAVASSPATKVVCGDATFDPPDVPAHSTVVVSAPAPVTAHSACSCSPRGDWNADLVPKPCSAEVDGTLLMRLYNGGATPVSDAETAPEIVDYCCTTK